MTIHPVVKRCLEQHERMRLERSGWEGVWQELKNYVRPDTADFAGRSSPGDDRRRMFDSTAPWSLEQLASGLHSSLTSPVDRFFSLSLVGFTPEELDDDAKAWLEMVSDEIYARYNHPGSNFHPSFHECYMDVAGFGTAVLYHGYDSSKDRIYYRSYPLADCWIEEDSDGRVDSIQRRILWNKRQILQEFPGFDQSEQFTKARDDQKFTVLHCVYPNNEYDGRSRVPAKRRLRSVYLIKETNDLLELSGFDWMPYHVTRWAKLAGETYGRGPGLSVLPDIRMVNAMSATVIKAAQKFTDPPLFLPDDGYMLPVRMTPGSINFYRAGQEQPFTLPANGRIEIGDAMIEQRRQLIRQGFYVDWLIRPQKKERQTAQEIIDDRNQMLSMLGPVIGRQQTELLGPDIELTYNYLDRAGVLPPMPASLDGANLQVVYTSPAARAQYSTKGQGMQAFLSQLTQLAPVIPGIMDGLRTERIGPALADITDVTRSIIASPAEIEQRKAERAQQQQLATMSEAAPAMAKTAKDLSAAQAGGLNLGGLL